MSTPTLTPQHLAQASVAVDGLLEESCSGMVAGVLLAERSGEAPHKYAAPLEDTLPEPDDGIPLRPLNGLRSLLRYDRQLIAIKEQHTGTVDRMDTSDTPEAVGGLGTLTVRREGTDPSVCEVEAASKASMSLSDTPAPVRSRCGCGCVAGGWERFRALCARALEQVWFEWVCLGLVLASVACLSVDTQFVSAREQRALNSVQAAFVMWFVVEWVIRLAGDGVGVLAAPLLLLDCLVVVFSVCILPCTLNTLQCSSKECQC